jgi:hypothetical protein
MVVDYLKLLHSDLPGGAKVEARKVPVMIVGLQTGPARAGVPATVPQYSMRI